MSKLKRYTISMRTYQHNLFTAPELDIASIIDEQLALTKQIARDQGLPTINSVSGGKTSAYMAIHYPADVNLFACVLTEDEKQAPKDKGLLRECQNKLPQFVASLEVDATLRALLDLEQLLGYEITWIAGITFDRLIREHSMLPNRVMRFCTEELKVKPIYDWVTKRYPNEIVEMRIGFRADEVARVYNRLGVRQIKGGWDISNLGDCEKLPKSKRRALWRYNQFPLYSDGVTHWQVKQFIASTGIQFPDVSNCAHCHFHTQKEHILQHEQNPEKAAWWIAQEEKMGKTFTNGTAMRDLIYGKPCPIDYKVNCGCTD